MLEPNAPIAGESDADFQRFCVYRDLGPRRSLSEAGRRCGLSLSRMKQLSSHYRWPPRASLWDIVSWRRRRVRRLKEAAEGREALLQEALGLQEMVKGEAAQWVRRGPEGRPELARELSLGQALVLWETAVKIEQHLVGYAQPQEPDGDPVRELAQEYLCVFDLFEEEFEEHVASLGADRGRIADLWLLVLGWPRSARPAESGELEAPEQPRPDPARLAL
jgi:hypothetical protein